MITTDHHHHHKHISLRVFVPRASPVSFHPSDWLWVASYATTRSLQIDLITYPTLNTRSNRRHAGSIGFVAWSACPARGSVASASLHDLATKWATGRWRANDRDGLNANRRLVPAGFRSVSALLRAVQLVCHAQNHVHVFEKEGTQQSGRLSDIFRNQSANVRMYTTKLSSANSGTWRTEKDAVCVLLSKTYRYWSAQCFGSDRMVFQWPQIKNHSVRATVSEFPSSFNLNSELNKIPFLVFVAYWMVCTIRNRLEIGSKPRSKR